MRKFNLILKRLFDILISIIFLTAFLPLMIIIAILIKLDSKDPVIYRQDRLGKNASTFVVYKFRTMYDKSSIGNLQAPSKNDPRVTKIGYYLRKTSLDELPQMFNVLNNTMSIIGPRAVPAKEIELRLEKMINENPKNEILYKNYMELRQTFKPGITGMAQAYGRSSLNTLEATKLDVYYVKNFTIILDFKIFINTITTVLLQKGVN